MARRMTKDEASLVLRSIHVDPHNPPDFHTLNLDYAYALAGHAKLYGYRKPKNANGSTGRYFYAYCCRTMARR